MASNGLPILFVWLLVSASVTAQINLSPCSHDEYFDTTNLQCISCPTNTLPNSTFLTFQALFIFLFIPFAGVPSSAESCVCANGYITTTSTTSTSGTCRSCLTIGLSASLDHSQCIACPNGLNMAIGDCVSLFTPICSPLSSPLFSLSSFLFFLEYLQSQTLTQTDMPLYTQNCANE